MDSYALSGAKLFYQKYFQKISNVFTIQYEIIIFYQSYAFLTFVKLGFIF